MAVKRFGIYTSFPPGVDMTKEGLGRHLAYFLQAAQQRPDIRFTLACPSWSRSDILALCRAYRIDPGSFDLLSPLPLPAFNFLRRRHKQLVKVVLAPLILLSLLGRRLLQPFVRLWRCIWCGLHESPPAPDVLVRFNLGGTRQRIFKRIVHFEISRLHRLIARRANVLAWYSPTSFWPRFNELPVPRLMCVPDVLVGDFPVGFARLSGAAFYERLTEIGEAIANGYHFVTYSDAVQRDTLGARYGIDPARVSVIRHGANRMDEALQSPDGTTQDTKGLLALFHAALEKALGHPDATVFAHEELRFLFYASQIRPSKNVLTLLRAYHYLLHHRYISHKLIMTGNPHVVPDVLAFVKDHKLENDVLFLHGLTGEELAACYKLADLAVNPTLFEGGCPFTFTEAVSVGTPVVMSDIPVAREVLTDPVLQAVTFFDPYDWRMAAARIETALQDLPSLLELQRRYYQARLVQRTWRHVVDDYIALLEQLAEQSEGLRHAA